MDEHEQKHKWRRKWTEAEQTRTTMNDLLLSKSKDQNKQDWVEWRRKAPNDAVWQKKWEKIENKDFCLDRTRSFDPAIPSWKSQSHSDLSQWRSSARSDQETPHEIAILADFTIQDCDFDYHRQHNAWQFFLVKNKK